MGFMMECLYNYIFMFPVFVILEIFVCLYYRGKGVRVTKRFILAYQLFFCLLAAMLTVTGAGGVNDIGRYGGEIIRLDEINLIPLVQWGLSDIEGLVLNIVLFVPFGVMAPLLWSEGASFVNTALSGFLFSLFIEVSQLLNWRATDIDDLIMNTLGTVLGYGVFRLILKRFTLLRIDNTGSGRLLRYSALISTIVVFLIYFLIGSPLISFVWHVIYS